MAPLVAQFLLFWQISGILRLAIVPGRARPGSYKGRLTSRSKNRTERGKGQCVLDGRTCIAPRPGWTRLPTPSRRPSACPRAGLLLELAPILTVLSASIRFG